MQPGSEEDFILNVGRRTFSRKAPPRSIPSPRPRSTPRSPGCRNIRSGWSSCRVSPTIRRRAQVALSQKRADAVMAYLAAGGIDRNRMWAKGYGKDRLVRDCPETACKVAEPPRRLQPARRA